MLGCPASSWTPPLLIGESFSLPCQEVYRGFNPKANVTWTCNEDTDLIFGIWNCTFGESVTISELAFSEHTISLEGLNETLAQLQSQVCATKQAIHFSVSVQHCESFTKEYAHISCRYDDPLLFICCGILLLMCA